MSGKLASVVVYEGVATLKDSRRNLCDNAVWRVWTMTVTHSARPVKFTKYSPVTGEALAEYVMANADAVSIAFQKAKQTQSAWQRVSLRKRAAVLNAIANQLVKMQDTLAHCISRETGKPLAEAIETELVPAVSVLSYYAKVGPKLLKDKALPFDKSILMGRTHYQRAVPRGVVGIIAPWNFPLATPVSGIASSLMAGNTVLLKPSELTPETGLLLTHLIQEAATPIVGKAMAESLCQCLLGDKRTGQLLCNEALDYLIFTGSTTTGQTLQSMLMKRGIPCSLELGGSDPMIVLDDADLDAVVSYAVWGRFTNAGQLCAAVKRLIVPKSHYETILALLKDKVSSIWVGPPTDPNSQMGPVISHTHLKTLQEQLSEARSKGARLITGGHVLDTPGYFLAPTVVADVFLNARIATEEVFGPILPVLAYESIEEAVAIANQTPYGLTASVFGPTQKAEAVARQLHAGCVVVNDVGTTSYAMPLIPWRGWKASGPGGSHGASSLLELTQTQIVTVNWLYHLAPFRKQPWHLPKEPNAKERFVLGKTLLRTYANERWLDKLNPALLKALWQNRSSQKR